MILKLVWAADMGWYGQLVWAAYQRHELSNATSCYPFKKHVIVSLSDLMDVL